MKIKIRTLTLVAGIALRCTAAPAEAPATYDEATLQLPTLVLNTQETPNERSATTYTTPVSTLEFDPRVDLQSRNMAEAQGDITIRGGIFENTGIRVGSATLIDPQTGHYFAELPIAPEMLEPYQVFTGADNALYGFNSTIGTISYGWSVIENGGSATIGGGDHDLNFQRLHHGWATPVGDSGKWSLGVEAEYSCSESDGTIKFGDHDFSRGSGRVQLIGPNSQTDFFAGYQEKFFGWTSMYSPAGFNETEDLKTRLFLLNHRQNYHDSSFIEFTGYFRRHSNFYVFSRENPAIFTATHETQVTSGALSGKHELNDAVALNYSGQFAADDIESTTLENNFTSRNYAKFSLLPEYKITLDSGATLTTRAGASYFDTNRNDSELSAIADITWKKEERDGSSKSVYLSYAETSQVVGYTAIGGGTVGLFASNPNLDTEISQNLEIGFEIDQVNWSLSAAVFHRWDDDLTDWTFDSTLPGSRTANPVDIETFGIELIATKQIGDFEFIASYAYLDKDEDYGSNLVDASFYALNYANHRTTLGGIWRPFEWVELRIDNEWRSQEDNALRNSDDKAIFTHIGVSFYPPQIEDLEIFFAGENIWEEDFEDVPGTPGRGDQYSAGVRYSW